MIPAFSTAISPGDVPRYDAWSTPIGVTTATAASATLVASQAPPMPTSTTATSTGASANAAYAIADDGLEEAQRVGLGRVDQVRVRRDVVERADELLVGQRLAVDADPLVHPFQVRAGEAPRAQVEGAQQRVDHPAGRGLAVGAGQVDHRVGPLRVAEELGEGPDPVERGLEPGLRPAREQGVLGLGEGLGEAGRLDRGVRGVGHLGATLLRGHSTRRFAMSTTRR